MEKVKGSPQPFGAVVSGNRVNFAVQVPQGKTCELLLYRAGRTSPEHCFEMPEDEGIGEVRFLAVEGIEAEKYEYNYRIGRKICVDPYVREVARRRMFRSTRCAESSSRPNMTGAEIHAFICPGMRWWRTAFMSEVLQNTPHRKLRTRGLFRAS